MSKATNHQRFECLFQWLASKGKFKRGRTGYESVHTKTVKDKVLEDLKLEL